jgi:hypothetical protein
MILGRPGIIFNAKNIQPRPGGNIFCPTLQGEAKKVWQGVAMRLVPILPHHPL